MSTVVSLDGKRYIVEELKTPIDLSDQRELPEGSIVIEHEIKGFETTILVIEDKTSEQHIVMFGMWVGEEVPLIVNVSDENVMVTAWEVLRLAWEE